MAEAISHGEFSPTLESSETARGETRWITDPHEGIRVLQRLWDDKTQPLGVEMGFGEAIVDYSKLASAVPRWIACEPEAGFFTKANEAPYNQDLLERMNEEGLSVYLLNGGLSRTQLSRPDVLVYRNPNLFTPQMPTPVPRYEELREGQRLVVLADDGKWTSLGGYKERMKALGYEPNFVRLAHPLTGQPNLGHAEYLFDVTKGDKGITRPSRSGLRSAFGRLLAR